MVFTIVILNLYSMAAAASSPELFINSVGTFITKSDLGVGAIVGSAVFNVLAVPACCGLFAGQVRAPFCLLLAYKCIKNLLIQRWYIWIGGQYQETA